MKNTHTPSKDLPIELPWNAYVNASVNFGKEQIIAGCTNIIGTLLSSEFVKNSALTELQKNTLVAISGPLFEKVWFYIGSFKHAWDIYRSTDPSIRNLVIRTAREGTRNTIKDFWVHDPVYLLLMWGWQLLHPNVPAWMLSFISFVLATIAVGVVDVGIDEAKYSFLQKNVVKQWFWVEKYYESRVALFKKQHMQDILEDLMKEFWLETSQTRKYTDTYYVVNKEKLKSYNGRKPSFRLRSRERTDQEAPARKSAQILYTKSNEITPKEAMHNRYYATKKEKLYFLQNHVDKLHTLSDIDNSKVRAYFQKILMPTSPQTISFERSLSYDLKWLLISVDEMEEKHAANPLQQTVELKVYKDEALLREAIRYVLTQYPVQQTTMRKHTEEHFGK